MEAARTLHTLDNAPDADVWEQNTAAWTRRLRSQGLSEQTIIGYRKSLAFLATWALAQSPAIVDPADMTTADLETWQAWALDRITSRGRQASPGAVAVHYRQLRVFFRWLTDVEQLDVNPFGKLSAPRVREEPVDMFTDDELRRLLDACKGRGFTERRDMAVIRLLLDTGIRLGEVSTIMLADVDLDMEIVSVRGKTGRRFVPIVPKTAEALDLYLRSRAKHPDRRDPALWLSDTSRHRGALGMSGIRLLLRRRADRAGVENVYPHRFRHTAAHAFLAAGGNDGAAMRLFGWKTRSMVDRYGASLADERAIAQARKLAPGSRV